MVITLDSSTMGSNTTLSVDGLTYTIANLIGGVRATEGKVNGIWFWEVKLTTLNSGNLGIGVVKESQNLKIQFYDTPKSMAGVLTNSFDISEVTSNNFYYTASDVIGVLLNFNSKTLTYYKNGINSYSRNFDLGSEPLYPVLTSASSGGGGVGVVNFGDSEFAHLPNDVPSGTLAYNGRKLVLDKRLALKNPTANQYYSLAEKTLIPLPDASNKNMISFGIEKGIEIKLDEEFDKVNYPVEGILKSTVKTTVKPLSVKFE